MSSAGKFYPHPPYSPDIAPSHYHLFRSLQNDLKERKFDDCKELESDLRKFFATKPESFYREGLHALPARWRKIVDLEIIQIVNKFMLEKSCTFL